MSMYFRICSCQFRLREQFSAKAKQINKIQVIDKSNEHSTAGRNTPAHGR